MRTNEDAIRSVRRWVASALGSPPWRVRLAMDGRFKRPFALVDTPTQRSDSQAAAATVLHDLPIQIHLYPLVPDDPVNVRASAARLIAERAGELLTTALALGVVDAADPTVRSYYGRIPLWDYTDADGNPLPLESTAADPMASVATRRYAPDYLWVPDGWTVRVMPEASEDQLFVVVANLRVQWNRNAHLRSPGTTLTSVQIETGPRS